LSNPDTQLVSLLRLICEPTLTGRQRPRSPGALLVAYRSHTTGSDYQLAKRSSGRRLVHRPLDPIVSQPSFRLPAPRAECKASAIHRVTAFRFRRVLEDVCAAIRRDRSGQGS
jgi:hypothetical protein